jgi:hypothetical protein
VNTRGRWRRAVGRVLISAVLLAPLAVVGGLRHEPFLVATLAATSATVLARPRRYRRTRRRIAGCYAVVLVGSLPLSLIGHLMGAPAIAIAAVLSVLAVASPPAGFHPPVAGVPHALVASSALSTVTAWLSVVAGSCYVLLALAPATTLLSWQASQTRARRSPAPSRWCSRKQRSA